MSATQTSAAARIGPGRDATIPTGSRGPRGWRRRRPDCGVAFEQTLVEHPLGAGVSLLSRLEEERHPTRQRLAVAGQHARGTRQHRHVGVVPAGVHATRLARRELEPGVLGHRQCIHVAAQQDVGTGAPALERRQHRRGLLGVDDVERQVADRLHHGRVRLRQVEPELGLGVDAPAQRDGAGQELARLGQQAHEARSPVSASSIDSSLVRSS